MGQRATAPAEHPVSKESAASGEQEPSGCCYCICSVIQAPVIAIGMAMFFCWIREGRGESREIERGILLF
jgi:hypothetical protein